VLAADAGQQDAVEGWREKVFYLQKKPYASFESRVDFTGSP
jgi:hypothetical protein